MPELFAYTDIGSSPPSPVDSSDRRLSWGKLVQRLTDFSTPASSRSMESGSNNSSRSDLSDSGKQCCIGISHLMILFFCMQVSGSNSFLLLHRLRCLKWLVCLQWGPVLWSNGGDTLKRSSGPDCTKSERSQRHRLRLKMYKTAHSRQTSGAHWTRAPSSGS